MESAGNRYTAIHFYAAGRHDAGRGKLDSDDFYVVVQWEYMDASQLGQGKSALHEDRLIKRGYEWP